ncbi:MAG: methionyl-tRNA formyltransferase [Egibacteraceae bacterium]
MNIVLVAEESAGIQALRLVTGRGHHVSRVLTSAPEGARGSTVAGVADQLGIEVLPARLVTKPALAEQMKIDGVDLLLNIHSLYVAHPDVIAAPTIGSFNLHPGPLPEYAGLNVPSWAIYHGQRRHGVTLHWMAAKVDAGHIAFADSFEIEPRDTGLTLTAKCVRRGLPLVDALLDLASTDPAGIPAIRQDLSLRRYFGRRVPHGGWVPWQLRARQVVDFVRACDYSPWASPWGEPRARAGSVEFTVRGAGLTGQPAPEPPGTVDGAASGCVLVAAADEWVLVERVQIEGRRVPPEEVLAPGERLEITDIE